jgi:ATP:ADP antiporter, AAA family
MASLDIDANQLLNLVVLLYLIAYFMTATLNNARVRQTRVKPEPLRATLNEGWGFVQEVPAFRFVMISMVGVAICVTVIEYHFLVMAEQTLAHDPGQFQTYFSIISLIQTFLSIGLQAFVTSRILSKMGLKNTFIVTPLLTFFSLVSMIGFPGLNSSAGGYLSTKVSWYTVDQSARKALQALVPEERRGRVSMFIDTYLFALGVIFGCILLGIVLLVRHFVIGGTSGLPYLILGLVSSAVTIWAIYRLRQVYDSSMFNWRLKRRQRTTSVLDRLNDDETIKRPSRNPDATKKRSPLDKLDNIE